MLKPLQPFWHRNRIYVGEDKSVVSDKVIYSSMLLCFFFLYAEKVLYFHLK